MRSRMIGLLLGTIAATRAPWLVPGELFACTGLALLFARHWRWQTLAGVLLGFSLVSCHGRELLATRLPDYCTGAQFDIEGTVVSLPRVSSIDETRKRQRFEFAVDTLSPAHCTGPRKVLLSWYGAAEILPGQRWRFQARLRRPWGLANEGSFNIQAWYAQTAIDAVGSVRESGAALLRSGQGQWLNRLRYTISQGVVEAGLSPRAGAVLRAVTVADKSGIDHQLWNLFQRFGINHLLVISGLHVGMVAGLGYFLGLGLGKGLNRVVGIPGLPAAEIVALGLAIAYTGLAGFSVATQRALYMLTCFMLARMLGRSSGAGNKLLIAAALIFLLNPMASLGSGFWLSFTAVGALLWLAHWGGAASKLKTTLAAHLYMGLLMLPLGGFWFGGGSWLSAPANLLMVPLIGLCVVPLALIGAVLFLAGSAYAANLWQFAAMPLDMLFSLETVSVGNRGLLPLQANLGALGLAMSGLALAVLPARRWPKVLIALLWLPLLLPQNSAPGAPTLTVLDVGQGTAVLFREGERALLYDTGGGNPSGANLAQSVVLPFLRNRGVARLDSLVISHSDLDHSAGLDSITGALPVGRVWLGGGHDTPGTDSACRAGQAWRWSAATRFQFLSPASTEALSDNDGSCVLLIESGQHRILLAGDIEEHQERELVSYWQYGLGSDLLLVAHHGSKTSTSQSWLNRVGPDTAIINNAYGNRFGHPAPEVVKRLDRHGIQVLHTARQGALDVRLEIDSSRVVTGWREGIKPWWM